jgi:hypothetical protein
VRGLSPRMQNRASLTLTLAEPSPARGEGAFIVTGNVPAKRSGRDEPVIWEDES